MSDYAAGPDQFSSLEPLGPTEQAFTCPYCWQTISMIIEPAAEEQTYIEDCEVCCNPIQVTFSRSPDGLLFQAEPIEQ